MAADEEADRPQRLAVTQESDDRRRDQYIDERARSEDFAHRIPARKPRWGRRALDGAAMPRLPHHEQHDAREQQPTNPAEHQPDAPPINAISAPPADQPDTRNTTHHANDRAT